MSAKNIGTKIKYLTAEESLPMMFQVGGNYLKDLNNYQLSIADDIAYYVNEKEYQNMIGVEIGYLKRYFLRAGHRTKLSQTKNQTISMGLGFNFNKYTIDYSLELNQGLTIPHRISLGYRY